MLLKIFLLVYTIYAKISLQNSFAQLQEDPKYDFRPESRHLDVNDGETYYIGFDETKGTNFSYCYYNSATISGSYPLVKGNDIVSLLELTDLPDEFRPYLNTGICAFIFDVIGNNSPKEWTLTVQDAISNQNFTETVTVETYSNMPLFLETVNVLQGSSYYNYFSSGESRFESCTLKFDAVTVKLDLNSETAEFPNDFTGNLKSRLWSLGDRGKCGVKVTNVDAKDTPEFTFIATDDQNITYRTKSKIQIFSFGSTFTNRTKEVDVGSYTTVECSITEPDSKQTFCILYNPQGEMVSEDRLCSFPINIVTVDDIGTWKCLVGHLFTMETLQFVTEIVEKKKRTVESWSENQDNFYTVGCKLINYPFSAKHCKFVRPDGTILNVHSGVASERYTSMSTNIEEAQCGIEISKPLTDDEKGSWKCEVLGESLSAGTYLTVEKPSELPYNKHLRKSVYDGDSCSISCSVSYFSPSCFITSPNGTRYWPDDPGLASLGKCNKLINNINSVDNGTWTCFFAREDGNVDENIFVEISVVNVKILYADAEADEGDEVVLYCNTGGTPLSSCRFISPTGPTYYLSQPKTTTTTRLSYYGRGLQNGDCGVKISKAEATDNGEWSCLITAGLENRNKIDLSAKMLLSISAPDSAVLTTAGSVGLVFGILVVVLAIGGIIVYRWRFRRVQRETDLPLQDTHSRSSNGSNNSRENIVTRQPDYNTNG